MTRVLTLLGATGSIGASTLDLVRRNREAWQVEALTAQCSAAELAALAIEFGAKLAVVGDEGCLPELRTALAGSGVEAAGGRQALVEAAARPVDMTVAAIVGCAGLAPVMAAIERGGTIALANKEALVSAGEVMMQAAARHGATLLPTDSEHNAIFQCLNGNRIEDVARTVLERGAVAHARGAGMSSAERHLVMAHREEVAFVLRQLAHLMICESGNTRDFAVNRVVASLRTALPTPHDARVAASQLLLDRGAARVILACTEVPLALDAIESPLRAHCVDTTAALARACVAWWQTSVR